MVLLSLFENNLSIFSLERGNLLFAPDQLAEFCVVVNYDSLDSFLWISCFSLGNMICIFRIVVKFRTAFNNVLSHINYSNHTMV